MPVSAEGRVGHQKLNQVAALPPGGVFVTQLVSRRRKNSVSPDASSSERVMGELNMCFHEIYGFGESQNLYLLEEKCEALA